MPGLDTPFWAFSVMKLAEPLFVAWIYGLWLETYLRMVPRGRRIEIEGEIGFPGFDLLNDGVFAVRRKVDPDHVDICFSRLIRLGLEVRRLLQDELFALIVGRDIVRTAGWQIFARLDRVRKYFEAISGATATRSSSIEY